MADYQHINERDKIEVPCLCGRIVSFLVGAKNNATRCGNCGRVILRSSIEKGGEG